MTSYDKLPEHMQHAAQDYVEKHRPVGHFLYAVLTNNLVDSFGKADEINFARMADWAEWLWNEAPARCWGSQEKVETWLDEEADDE